MRLLIDIAIALLIATVLGVATAWYAVENGRLFGAVHMLPWTAWPESGGPDADPYAVAYLARSGELPLGAGEGLAFSTFDDSAGEALDGDCTYFVTGQTPPARLWTLTAYNRAGQLMRNVASRYGFHSRELLRQEDGSLNIVLSADVQPGDWLPVARGAKLMLVLRLYDTPLTTATEFVDLDMPRIAKGECR